MPENETQIETQIALLQTSIENGFRDFGRRFDDLKTGFSNLSTRVHDLELQVAKDQVSSLRKEVDEWSSKIMALEVKSQTDAIRSRMILAAVGFASSIFGAIVTHFLTKA